MAPMAPMMPAMPTPAAVSCWEAPEDWEAEPPVVAEPVEDAPAEVLPPLGELAPPEVVGVEPPEVLVPAGALVVAAPVDWAPSAPCSSKLHRKMDRRTSEYFLYLLDL